MRDLFAFFRKFRVFLFFVALQVFALSTYFTYLSFPRSQYLTSASEINGKILKVSYEVTKHFNLSQNNTLLQQENIALRKQLPQSFMALQSGNVLINDTLHKQRYEYIPATVIKSTFNHRNNYFTLNIGSVEGVERDMGVFTDNGIVGIIHNVSAHFSVVKSVLTEAINIDVMVESTGAFGMLKWDGKDARIGSITGISNDIKVKKWSKVVTRGGSGIFPRGLPVGKISNLKPVEGKPLWDISLLYSEDYRKIQRVYVAKNIMKDEQLKLESLIPIDKE
ncbi:MAG: rod shape-determining protein MreC [Crocinitomicaceae bacterium]|nr:rod shape-determining protein MreC [Crocinitomicaceae bacterium]